ncbi:hypothetical protein TNCV_54931 [Trichonephila clavipes]|nr:hypothetical protein TNCV_54931 [Trichonephila clavipes]
MGNKIDLASFAYFVTAGVVLLGDRGPVLNFQHGSTNECGWNARRVGGNKIDLTSFFLFNIFVWAGCVVLGDGGHVLVLRSCASKNMSGMCVVLGDGGHVLVLRSCAKKNMSGMWEGRGPVLDFHFVTAAGVVILVDRGPVLDFQPGTTNECGWNAGG